MISVLIVCYNEAKHIEECLAGIENQFIEGDIWELIVVDGKSTDNTVELANNYLQNKTYPWQIIKNKKKTLATGWNLGIKLAKGEFVIRPDAHAKLHKGYIKGALNVLQNKSEVLFH